MSERVSYKGKSAIVTGGLGFIGSNLAIRLVNEGARVTVIDPAVIGCGANLFNLAAVRDRIRLIGCSIADAEVVAAALESSDVAFNLAGEISHIHSMVLPARDLEINTLAQLRFLETCIRVAPGIRVVYAGTRQVYGVPEYLPVDENHPVNPVDYNGVHKYAATQYHLMLSRIGKLDGVVLRLTNVYGPRMALDVPCQGFLSTYLRKALTGQPLEIFGDGRQLRDPLYVDDVVEALLAAGARDPLEARSYNIGGPEALTIGGIAEALSAAAGLPAPAVRDFPAERKAIDIGSYRTDSTRARDQLNWYPRVPFAEGIARTLAYYRRDGCLMQYMDPANPNPECKLAHPSAPAESAPRRQVPA